MTTALDRATFVAAAERRATRAVTVNTVASAWWVGGWFWVIYILVLAVLTVVFVAVDEAGARSASGSFGAPWVFVFVMGIVLTSQTATLHLVAGGTRHTFLRGGRWSAVGVGVTFGIASWALLVLRDTVVRLLGHEVAPVDGVLDAAGSGLWLALLVHVVASVALFATGALVGLAFRRLGGWFGTLALTLTLLPGGFALWAFEQAAGDGSTAPDARAWLLVLVGGVAATLAAWWGAWLVGRGAPVR